MTDNLRGSLFMVLAMLGFAIEDMLLKRVATAGMPVGQVLILFGGGGCLAFAALTRMQGQRIWHPAVVQPRMLLKAGFEVMGRLFFTLAIALTPPSSASAILQATPLVVVAGAALIFGERVGWRRWLAILLGLVGVLVILRPGFLAFGWAAFLPLTAALGMSLTMIGNRMVAQLGSALAMQFAITAIASVVLGIIVVAGHWSGMPTLHVGPLPPVVLAKCVFVAAVLTTGHWLVFKGTTRVGAGTLAPMTYMQLLGATFMGWLVFGDRPDRTTLLGAAMIVGSGLYLWWKGRIRDVAELP